MKANNMKYIETKANKHYYRRKVEDKIELYCIDNFDKKLYLCSKDGKTQNEAKSNIVLVMAIYKAILHLVLINADIDENIQPKFRIDLLNIVMRQNFKFES